MESLWLECVGTINSYRFGKGFCSADNALRCWRGLSRSIYGQSKKIRGDRDYGIIRMAFVFRFAALFAISFIANVWQVQADMARPISYT